MDFSRKILSNYGWKEGDGLGKNRDGIAKPLRATLKFDNAGFGADQAAADFNNHWWERVFNEAATNVNIKQEGETIKIGVKDNEDGVEISTKGYSMNKLKKLKKNRRGKGSETKNGYENFLQAATLTNLCEIENPDKIDTNDIEVSKMKVLTDEELFKACGGRTAHKGARHGLKLSGKLTRIEQQEAELLAKMLAKRNGLDETIKLETKVQELKQKSKKCQDVAEVSELADVDIEKSNKKKRKHSELECTSETAENSQEISEHKSKKKKKKISDDGEIETQDVEATSKRSIMDNDETIPKKKKKKSKKQN